MSTSPTPSTLKARDLIESIVTACPRRVAGSVSERRGHEMLAVEFEALGLGPKLLGFRHNRSLYANLALHFALPLVGVLCWALGHPALAAVCMGVCGVSYTLESEKRLMVLRHLFPFHDSQNLVVTQPATAPLRRRLVVVAHVDAAFTGWIFHPALIKKATAPPPHPRLGFLRKSLGIPTVLAWVQAAGAAACAALDCQATWVWVLAGVMSVPAGLTVFFNAQVVFKNTVVPGANDNLTGCAAIVEMARRFGGRKPEDVELVWVATGCEEAGTGGAWALAEQMQEHWDPQTTWVLGVDTLSGGTLKAFEEGELGRVAIPEAWRALVQAHLPHVATYEIPSGATDALPFLVRGYTAMTLGCVDDEIGAPRHYHRPSDKVANLDLAQLERSFDDIEVLIEQAISTRSGTCVS